MLLSKLRKVKAAYLAKKLILDYYVLNAASKLKFLHYVFYLFSGTMYTEYKVYLAGKKKYLENYFGKGNVNVYLLRRNIHRIEKGLIHPVTRKVFAEAFIEETVEQFDKLNELCTHENCDYMDEWKWANDVLEKYFSVTGSSEKLDRARKHFNTVKKINSSEITNIPYERDSRKYEDISFESFYQLAKKRRSVRWFTDEKVPRDLVDKAVEAAAQAPSACNRQPFKILFFDDKEFINKLGKIPLGFTDFYKKLPMLAVIIGQQHAYVNRYDRHTIYIDSSLFTMSFILALETLGLSSCVINWTDRPNKIKEINEVIKLEKDERVINYIAIGYADSKGKIPYSKKKGLDELRVYNKLK